MTSPKAPLQTIIDFYSNTTMDPNEQPSWSGDAPDKEKMEQASSKTHLSAAGHLTLRADPRTASCEARRLTTLAIITCRGFAYRRRKRSRPTSGKPRGNRIGCTI